MNVRRLKCMTIKNKNMKKFSGLSRGIIAASTMLPLASVGLAADSTATTATPATSATPATPLSESWQKPVWLTDLSAGVKESYDDNVFLVSGDGLKPQTSWVTGLTPKIGFNFAPLLGSTDTLQTLSLSYAPDVEFYHEAPSQDYTANRINNAVKLKAGDFSLGLDNAFLYNDGNREAYLYALKQTSPTGADQYDKYRNNYAHGVVRERLNQYQDRNATTLQYDWDQFFVRPTASLLYYGLNTYQHNTGAPATAGAPSYEGYQNYVNRYDVNGGTDLGYKVTKDTALTLGYRYGHQYQEQFATAISSDSHDASSDYQRVLAGVEGQPLNWLTVKVDGGPDFRNYNSAAAIANKNQITYYGEALVTARINATQSLTASYKQWQWVASTGNVGYFDSTYGLNYHWNATPKLGLDLGGKLLTADYRSGNDFAGSAPSARDDGDYAVAAGVSYAFCSHLSANLSYNYDLGKSELSSAELAQGGANALKSAGFRDFEHQVVSLGLLYKF